MNARERRAAARYWPHYVEVNFSAELLDECTDWLHNNFGTCKFNTRNNPRWCWRPNYGDVGGNFANYRIGIQLFFRKKEDYAWFLLKWNR